MHVHLGPKELAVTFLYVVIAGFFWRVVAAHNSNNALGQAMSFIY